MYVVSHATLKLTAVFAESVSAGESLAPSGYYDCLLPAEPDAYVGMSGGIDHLEGSSFERGQARSAIVAPEPSVLAFRQLT